MIRPASVKPAVKDVPVTVVVSSDRRTVGKEPVYRFPENCKIIPVPKLSPGKQYPFSRFREKGVVADFERTALQIFYAVEDISFLYHKYIISQGCQRGRFFLTTFCNFSPQKIMFISKVVKENRPQ